MNFEFPNLNFAVNNFPDHLAVLLASSQCHLFGLRPGNYYLARTKDERSSFSVFFPLSHYHRSEPFGVVLGIPRLQSDLPQVKLIIEGKFQGHSGHNVLQIHLNSGGLLNQGLLGGLGDDPRRKTSLSNGYWGKVEGLEGSQGLELSLLGGRHSARLCRSHIL